MKILKNAVYRLIYWIIKLLYPPIKLVGLENLPEEPCVIVGNHAQMNGPIAGQLYFPGKRYIWCAHEMMFMKEVPSYAYRDFWSRKPKALQPLYKLLSYVIAPLSVCVFNCADTIAVYRDKRVILTLRETVEKLRDGANVIIFPEHDAPHNHVLCDFQDGFVSVAKSYYSQTGKALAFVPMYLAPKLREMVLGEPVYFDPEAPGKEERRRITGKLMDAITEIAVSLPRHKMVPYLNISKKDYPYNIPEEVTTHEKTSC